MTEEITREVFDHLVDLAALAMDQPEAAYLRRELNSQLASIRELESIELPEGTAITSHGVPYAPAIRPSEREDQVVRCKDSDDILAGAPQVERRYVVVPEIPYEELE